LLGTFLFKPPQENVGVEIEKSIKTAKCGVKEKKLEKTRS
jgi:hypothetical protein